MNSPSPDASDDVGAPAQRHATPRPEALYVTGRPGHAPRRTNRVRGRSGVPMVTTRLQSASAPSGMGAVTACPECAGQLRAVSDGEMTNLWCGRCGRCWHLELGWMSRVDPVSCPGCAKFRKCLARWLDDPSWRPNEGSCE